MLNTNTIRLQRLLDINGDINGDMLTLTMIVAHVDILFSLKETNVAKMIKCFCCLHDISYSEGTRDVLSCISVKAVTVTVPVIHALVYIMNM